jgi:hypothetical protein
VRRFIAAFFCLCCLVVFGVRRFKNERKRRCIAALQKGPKAWQAWAARGWCRHLLGNPEAHADLQKASDLHPDEPGLWALRGTVCLKHQRLDDAEAVHKRLAARKGIDVAIWQACEAQACAAEGAKEEADWHRKHLPDKPNR